MHAARRCQNCSALLCNAPDTGALLITHFSSLITHDFSLIADSPYLITSSPVTFIRSPPDLGASDSIDSATAMRRVGSLSDFMAAEGNVPAAAAPEGGVVEDEDAAATASAVVRSHCFDLVMPFEQRSRTTDELAARMLQSLVGLVLAAGSPIVRARLHCNAWRHLACYACALRFVLMLSMSPHCAATREMEREETS